MQEIPKTLIVVGGGVIGMEYVCMFATLGVRVILVEKRARLAGICRRRNGRGAFVSASRPARDDAPE